MHQAGWSARGILILAAMDAADLNADESISEAGGGPKSCIGLRRRGVPNNVRPAEGQSGVSLKRRQRLTPAEMADDDSDNPAMKFLKQNIFNPEFAAMAELALSLPKHVKLRIRIVCVGAGPRLRDCCLCCTPCNAIDPILGPGFYLLWAHLEELPDELMAVQGHVCLICAGVLRRRYKGWKLKELRDRLLFWVARGVNCISVLTNSL